MATDIQAVRQAAETEMKFSAEACPPDHPLCKFYEAVRLRHRMLAEYALTTISADGHMAINTGYLQDEWGAVYDEGGTRPKRSWIIKASEGTMLVDWFDGCRVFFNDSTFPDVNVQLATIYTRQEFCAIATALGIQRKRKDGAA